MSKQIHKSSQQKTQEESKGEQPIADQQTVLVCSTDPGNITDQEKKEIGFEFVGRCTKRLEQLDFLNDPTICTMTVDDRVDWNYDYIFVHSIKTQTSPLNPTELQEAMVTCNIIGKSQYVYRFTTDLWWLIAIDPQPYCKEYATKLLKYINTTQGLPQHEHINMQALASYLKQQNLIHQAKFKKGSHFSPHDKSGISQILRDPITVILGQEEIFYQHPAWFIKKMETSLKSIAQPKTFHTIARDRDFYAQVAGMDEAAIDVMLNKIYDTIDPLTENNEISSEFHLGHYNEDDCDQDRMAQIDFNRVFECNQHYADKAVDPIKAYMQVMNCTMGCTRITNQLQYLQLSALSFHTNLGNMFKLYHDKDILDINHKGLLIQGKDGRFYKLALVYNSQLPLTISEYRNDTFHSKITKKLQEYNIIKQDMKEPLILQCFYKSGHKTPDVMKVYLNFAFTMKVRGINQIDVFCPQKSKNKRVQTPLDDKGHPKVYDLLMHESMRQPPHPIKVFKLKPMGPNEDYVGQLFASALLHHNTLPTSAEFQTQRAQIIQYVKDRLYNYQSMGVPLPHAEAEEEKYDEQPFIFTASQQIHTSQMGSQINDSRSGDYEAEYVDSDIDSQLDQISVDSSESPQVKGKKMKRGRSAQSTGRNRSRNSSQRRRQSRQSSQSTNKSRPITRAVTNQVSRRNSQILFKQNPDGTPSHILLPKEQQQVANEPQQMEITHTQGHNQSPVALYSPLNNNAHFLDNFMAQLQPQFANSGPLSVLDGNGNCTQLGRILDTLKECLKLHQVHGINHGPDAIPSIHQYANAPNLSRVTATMVEQFQALVQYLARCSEAFSQGPQNQPLMSSPFNYAQQNTQTMGLSQSHFQNTSPYANFCGNLTSSMSPIQPLMFGGFNFNPMSNAPVSTPQQQWSNIFAGPSFNLQNPPEQNNQKQQSVEQRPSSSKTPQKKIRFDEQTRQSSPASQKSTTSHAKKQTTQQPKRGKNTPKKSHAISTPQRNQQVLQFPKSRKENDSIDSSYKESQQLQRNQTGTMEQQTSRISATNALCVDLSDEEMRDEEAKEGASGQSRGNTAQGEVIRHANDQHQQIPQTSLPKPLEVTPQFTNIFLQDERTDTELFNSVDSGTKAVRKNDESICILMQVSYTLRLFNLMMGSGSQTFTKQQIQDMCTHITASVLDYLKLHNQPEMINESRFKDPNLNLKIPYTQDQVMFALNLIATNITEHPMLYSVYSEVIQKNKNDVDMWGSELPMFHFMPLFLSLLNQNPQIIAQPYPLASILYRLDSVSKFFDITKKHPQKIAQLVKNVCLGTNYDRDNVASDGSECSTDVDPICVMIPSLETYQKEVQIQVPQEPAQDHVMNEEECMDPTVRADKENAAQLLDEMSNCSGYDYYGEDSDDEHSTDTDHTLKQLKNASR